MGDTKEGSWTAAELGGFIQREEARKEWERLARKAAQKEEFAGMGVVTATSLLVAGWILGAGCVLVFWWLASLWRG